MRVNSFTEWPYHKHHTKASLSTQLKNWVKNDKNLLNLKFYCAKLIVRKSSQIWNLCRGNKYVIRSRFFWLFTLYILWSVEAILKIRTPVKKTDWKTLTGRQAPVWEKRFTYSRSYLAIAFVHALNCVV